MSAARLISASYSVQWYSGLLTPPNLIVDESNQPLETNTATARRYVRPDYKASYAARQACHPIPQLSPHSDPHPRPNTRISLYYHRIPIAFDILQRSTHSSYSSSTPLDARPHPDHIPPWIDIWECQLGRPIMAVLHSFVFDVDIPVGCLQPISRSIWA